MTTNWRSLVSKSSELFPINVHLSSPPLLSFPAPTSRGPTILAWAQAVPLPLTALLSLSLFSLQPPSFGAHFLSSSPLVFAAPCHTHHLPHPHHVRWHPPPPLSYCSHTTGPTSPSFAVRQY